MAVAVDLEFSPHPHAGPRRFSPLDRKTRDFSGLDGVSGDFGHKSTAALGVLGGGSAWNSGAGGVPSPALVQGTAYGRRVRWAGHQATFTRRCLPGFNQIAGGRPRNGRTVIPPEFPSSNRRLERGYPGDPKAGREEEKGGETSAWMVSTKSAVLVFIREVSSGPALVGAQSLEVCTARARAGTYGIFPGQ